MKSSEAMVLAVMNTVLAIAERSLKNSAPNISGFIAQLVRALLRHCEVTSSNPIEALNFSGFSMQLLLI